MSYDEIDGNPFGLSSFEPADLVACHTNGLGYLRLRQPEHESGLSKLGDDLGPGPRPAVHRLGDWVATVRHAADRDAARLSAGCRVIDAQFMCGVDRTTATIGRNVRAVRQDRAARAAHRLSCASEPAQSDTL